MSNSLPLVGNTAVDAQGIAFVQSKVTSPPNKAGLGFLFRPLVVDFGLDGQIEVAYPDSDGRPVATGKILSVQIKTGSSYFKNEHKDEWLVYVQKSTVNYWRSHSLPVILILVDIELSRAYWVQGDSSEHEEKNKTYCIKVPKLQQLDTKSAQALAELADNTTEEGRRFARLEIDLPIILSALDGNEIILDIMHWINKSSGRMDYWLGTHSDQRNIDGPDRMVVFSSGTVIGTGGDLIGTACFVAPWSDPEPHTEFEEQSIDTLYDDYLAETGIWDKEDDRYIDVLDAFDKWLEDRRSYEESDSLAYYVDSEVRRYRLLMKPSDLAKSFVVTYAYIHNINPDEVPRWPE